MLQFLIFLLKHVLTFGPWYHFHSCATWFSMHSLARVWFLFDNLVHFLLSDHSVRNSLLLFYYLSPVAVSCFYVCRKYGMVHIQMTAFRSMLRTLRLAAMQLLHFQWCRMLLAACKLLLLVDPYQNVLVTACTIHAASLVQMASLRVNIERYVWKLISVK